MRPFSSHLVLALVLLITCAEAVVLERRQRICGSDSDCVTVRAGPEAQIIIDGLDLTKDTPRDVLMRLPSWFGPKGEKHALEYFSKRLDSRVPLADQKVQVGHTVLLIVENEDL